jgi:microcystin-dependent protein
MTSVLRRQGDLSATQRPTVGDLKMSMVGVDHIGWLFCNGRQLPISAFQQLFDVVGYSFGTDVSAGYFRLPNPQGRVLGMVGQSAGTSDWAMGDVSGEEVHTLTVDEMPTHNHDFAGGSRLNTYGFTDVSGQHIHGITDPGHTHGYVNQVNNQNTDNAFATEIAADQVDINQTTTSSETGITINPAGAHRHQIAANGGDQPHNNIQPTLWVGNLFVYSGRLFRDAPSGGNWFPPQGPPINVN